MLSADQLENRISELAVQITEDYADKNPVLIGTLKGGFIFLAMLALKLDFDLEIDFIFARSYGSSQTSAGRVDLYKNLSIDIKDRDLLVVEDIVDSGFTLLSLLQNFKLGSPRSINVITLLDKKNARKVDVPIKYVGFEIENKFVVGFGLDYSEKFRNLPYVATFKHMNEK